MRESLTLEERNTNRFRFYIAKSIINREISGTIESASGIQVIDIDFNPENKYVSFIAKLANGEVLNCNSEGFVLLDEHLGTDNYDGKDGWKENPNGPLFIKDCLLMDVGSGDYIEFSDGSIMQMDLIYGETMFQTSIIRWPSGEFEFRKYINDSKYNLGFAKFYHPDKKFYLEIAKRTGKLWIDEKKVVRIYGQGTPGHFIDMPKSGEWISANWPPSPYNWMGKKSEDYFPKFKHSLIDSISIDKGIDIICNVTSFNSQPVIKPHLKKPIHIDFLDFLDLTDLSICSEQEVILLNGLLKANGIDTQAKKNRPELTIKDLILVKKGGIWEVAMFGRWVEDLTLATIGGEHYSESDWMEFNNSYIGTNNEKPIE